MFKIFARKNPDAGERREGVTEKEQVLQRKRWVQGWAVDYVISLYYLGYNEA